jgi:hypothetical protein
LGETRGPYLRRICRNVAGDGWWWSNGKWSLVWRLVKGGERQRETERERCGRERTHKGEIGAREGGMSNMGVGLGK